MRLPARRSEFRVWGVGLGAEGLELRGLRFRASGLGSGLRVYGSRNWSLGFIVGALIVRIGFRCILYHNHNKEPPQ